ncbi:MsnO8 family LLM class oxidoreductase [Aeromicrobium sp. CnD17-E]|uniref:MsnO8 family LLM class oxidoreductase n=1 Tax=Aeromicrobium sp. CnD17-E TaxID=2954487 RepID=UPI0020978555|nr:MsnO8 family LLM class oxidoreductase [Aeromicrobium sp. CnD17-E]MCO7238385.1 MsnO8 family LLM class oxidoreductase [Aeromicrobium sp. CnD17-E]
MRLSLLDRSRTRAGHPDAEGLTGSVARAVWAEELGYDRFWVAEHHAVPGIASGAPPVLMAAVGAATSRIRIGSGGIMLPHHQPIVVAEQVRMLEALHPGRVDVGLGRSSGFTPPVREALRETPDAADRFADDVRELRGLLAGRGAVTVRPAGGPVPVYLLATGRGVTLAAELGLPVVVGGPALWSDALPPALAAYRRDFRPSPDADTPQVLVSLDVLVADDVATARELALPEAWAMAQSRRTGVFEPLESPAAIRAQEWPEQVRRRVEASLEQAVAGDAGTVRRTLEELAERTGADELLASTSTWDRDALRAADAALRALV